MAAELIELWRHHLTVARNASPHTVRAYIGDLHHLVDYLDRTESGTLTDVDLRTLRRWLAGMHAAGAERATMQRRAAAARVFFAWAHAAGLLPHDPAAGLRAPLVDRTLPPTLEVDHARGALCQRHSGRRTVRPRRDRLRRRPAGASGARQRRQGTNGSGGGPGGARTGRLAGP